MVMCWGNFKIPGNQEKYERSEYRKKKEKITDRYEEIKSFRKL